MPITGEIIKVKRYKDRKKRDGGYEFWLREDSTGRLLYITLSSWQFLQPGQRIELEDNIESIKLVDQLLLC